MEVNWKNEKGSRRESERVAALSRRGRQRRLARLQDGWVPPNGVTPEDEREMLLTLQDAQRQGLPR